jgi:hypothetical protein
LGHTEQIEFVLSVESDGIERDIWRLIREPTEIRSFHCDHPETVFTWKDGQAQYVKLQDEARVGEWQVQQRAKSAGYRGKHLMPGWHRRWEDAASPWTPIQGIRATHENFHAFPESNPASSDKRMPVPLRPGEILRGWHYLCAPEEEANLRASVGKGAIDNWFWSVRDWQPFSIVHVAAYPAR